MVIYADTKARLGTGTVTIDCADSTADGRAGVDVGERTEIYSMTCAYDGTVDRPGVAMAGGFVWVGNRGRTREDAIGEDATRRGDGDRADGGRRVLNGDAGFYRGSRT